MKADDDILRGVKNIADYMKVPYYTAWRMLAREEVSSGRLCGVVIASKRRIDAELDEIASGKGKTRPGPRARSGKLLRGLSVENLSRT
jgi:hypothetical protein